MERENQNFSYLWLSKKIVWSPIRFIEKLLEIHPRVVLKPLSRYSPDINPQEQWWNYERAKLLNNRYFPTNRRLGGAVRHFVRNTPPAAVKSACNLSAIYGLLK